MTNRQCDIAILGAGMVGLSAALLLANDGWQVALVDPYLPKLEWPTGSHDLRTVALNPHAIECLRKIGVWSQLHQREVGIMQNMHVWDKAGGSHIDFDAAKVDQALLSAVIENRVLVKTLWQQAIKHSNITCLAPHAPSAFHTDESHINCQLDDQLLQAKCLLGADGRQSWVRKQLGLAINQHDYQQQAVVAIIHSDNPHNNTGYQAFLPTGPIGLLPLSDPHLLSMVWSTTPEHSQKLLEMSDMTFNTNLSNALDLKLGLCQRHTELKAYPLRALHSENYTKPRAALLGDAAHAIHPLAGQGANLGIADAHCLQQVFNQARRQKQDIGSMAVLQRYQRERYGKNQAMLNLMRAFKSTFCDQSSWVMQLRNFGLNLANRSDALKQLFIHYAS